MQSDLDGRNVQPFFKNNANKTCTCPFSSSVMPMMTVDKTNIQKPMIYWVSIEGHLNVADIYGCMCNVVLHAGFKTATLTSLTVDKVNIYWSNATENRIYFMRKEYPFSVDKENMSKPEIKSLYLPNVRHITAFGKSLQAYPTTKCLIPRRKAYSIERVNATATSIVVNLPETSPEIGCENYSLPSTLYIIHVHCQECEGFELRTYERHYEIQNLKPFTNYTLELILSNVYIKQFKLPTLSGLDVVLMTDPGKPYAPENFTVKVLTPTLAAVYWMPPKILNCAAVHYEVHWISPLLVNGSRHKGEQVIKDKLHLTEDGRFFTMLKPFLPNQEYQVYMRVYPVNFTNLYNETLKKTINMYSEPNNLTLSGRSVNSMNISWIPNINLTIEYTLQYKDDSLDTRWQIADSFELKQYKITYHIRNLQPRTLYKFRLILKYSTYAEDFIWPSDERFTFQTLGK